MTAPFLSVLRNGPCIYLVEYQADNERWRQFDTCWSRAEAARSAKEGKTTHGPKTRVVTYRRAEQKEG